MQQVPDIFQKDIFSAGLDILPIYLRCSMHHVDSVELVDEKMLDIILRFKLNVERKVKVKANAENRFVRKFFVA